MATMTMREKTNDSRLSYSFSRSLPFRRASCSKIVRIIAENYIANQGTDNRVSQNTIWAETELGNIDAQASYRWLKGFGVINDDDLLTRFGHLVHRHDPHFQEISTAWICHYNMSAPHRNGPSFWSYLWQHATYWGDTLSAATLAEKLQSHASEETEKIFSLDTYTVAARSFLTCYGNSEGLGRLNLLQKGYDDAYTVEPPIPVDWKVAAYVLADYWSGVWGDTTVVPYPDIMAPGGPASLLRRNTGDMGLLLRPMQEAGLLQISRVARPWTVARAWSDPGELLEAVYEANTANAPTSGKAVTEDVARISTG